MIRLLSIGLFPFVVHHYRSIFKLQRRINSLNHGIVRTVLVSCYWRWCAKYCAWIGLDAKFLGEPILPHGLNGIFISGESTIGRNCIIYHQVTIGSELNQLGGGGPILKDNVYCGAGSKIIGRIVVGEHVRIGANCCVYRDVPDNCVAVNSPTRLIQKENLINRRYTRNGNEWFYYEDGKWVNCSSPQNTI